MTAPQFNPLLGSEYHFNDKAGKFIPARHERLAEIISDYDQSLDLVLVPSQVPPEPQYAVIQWVDSETYWIVSWWQADQLDERILEQIWKNDFQKHHPDEIWNELMAKQEAQQLMEQKKQEDEQAEKWEVAQAILQSKKNWYKHDGKVYRG